MGTTLAPGLETVYQHQGPTGLNKRRNDTQWIALVVDVGKHIVRLSPKAFMSRVPSLRTE